MEEEEKRTTRDEYPHSLAIQTRWNDNDVYGHVNNVVYYGWFDTVINDWLIREGGLDIHDGSVVGFCVESRCNYYAPVSFPEPIEAALRVARLGDSSVTYEVGIFKESAAEAIAEGHFVHVFVEVESNRPSPIPEPIRACMERLR